LTFSPISTSRRMASGRQRMTREAKAEPKADCSEELKAILKLFGKLDPASRKAMACYLQTQVGS
jgi:hypothetical protein